MADRDVPDGDVNLERLRVDFPFWAWTYALAEGREKRKREQRALTSAELEQLRRFYPATSEVTQGELTLLYGHTAQFWEFKPRPPWEWIAAELSAEPESAKQARLLDLQIADLERGPAGSADPLAPSWNDPPGMKMRPGPRPVVHERESLVVALQTLKSVLVGAVEQAMAASGLNKKDVLRVERMHRGGLLVVDDDSTLWVSDRVLQHGVALRVLSPDGSAWVDPLDGAG